MGVMSACCGIFRVLHETGLLTSPNEKYQRVADDVDLHIWFCQLFYSSGLVQIRATRHIRPSTQPPSKTLCVTLFTLTYIKDKQNRKKKLEFSYTTIFIRILISVTETRPAQSVNLFIAVHSVLGFLVVGLGFFLVFFSFFLFPHLLLY